MREFLFTLTGLTLGGSAAVCLLALAGRSTRCLLYTSDAADD